MTVPVGTRGSTLRVVQRAMQSWSEARIRVQSCGSLDVMLTKCESERPESGSEGEVGQSSISLGMGTVPW